MNTECGTIYREGRDILITLPDRNEAYLLHEADFEQFLTRYAARGCKLSEIADMLPPEDAEGLK